MSNNFVLPIWMRPNQSASPPEWQSRFVQQFGRDPDNWTPAAHAFLRTSVVVNAFGLEWPGTNDNKESTVSVARGVR
jgi:hypothetical protein